MNLKGTLVIWHFFIFRGAFVSFVKAHLIYKYVTDEAKNDSIIPTAANVPPINVTVRYEYLTDSILDKGPENSAF